MAYQPILNQSDNLKRLVREAVLFSIKAHKQVFDAKNLPAALAYLHRASTKMSVAESLYYSNPVNAELEDLFALFDAFCNEILDDFATNHSQQWTAIHYNSFLDAIKTSEFALLT